ncbi:MAG TPA: hypothetical protein VMV18_04180 [bacterium]|nr:hypothetical protein [bacterium]
MAEKNVSQAHNQFKKQIDEQAARMESWQEEFGKLEAKGFEQAREAIDESAKIMKAGFDLAADLSAAWRQLAVEAMRRGTEMMTPRI